MFLFLEIAAVRMNGGDLCFEQRGCLEFLGGVEAGGCGAPIAPEESCLGALGLF